jgi:dethiobiotin synthetase
MSRGIFITGTDTGVGKTLVTVTLMRAFACKGLRVNGMKPVASGSERTAAGLRNSDAVLIQHAATVPLTYEAVNPYAFEPPIAPHIAAKRAGIHIDLNRLTSAYERLSAAADVTLVEGAGGWRTPLDRQRFLSDLPERLGLDVVLSVGLRLGCLNHALLTTEAIRVGGRARLVGWVGSCIDVEYACIEENIASLRELIQAPCLGIIPNLKEPTPEKAQVYVSLPEPVG